MNYTLTQKIACLERELRLRFRVYPRRVERGLMTQVVAKHEIEVLRSIVLDYYKLRGPELEL